MNYGHNMNSLAHPNLLIQFHNQDWFNLSSNNLMFTKLLGVQIHAE